MKRIPKEIIKEYDELEYILKNNPYLVQHQINLADFLLDNELFKLALPHYEEIVAHEPTDSSYVKLAVCYLKEKNTNAAFECFSKCAYDDNTLELIHECFKQTFNTNDENALVHYYLEHIEELLKAKLYEDALHAIQYIQNYKISDYFLYSMGKLCFDYEIYDIATICLTKSIMLIPLDITYYLRAKGYKAQEEYKLALNDVETLLIENQDDLDYILLRGQLYLSLSEFEKACIDFKTVLKLDENNKEAKEKLKELKNKTTTIK